AGTAEPAPTSARLTPTVTRLVVANGEEDSAAAALRGLPGVVAVEPVRTRRYTAVPDDPFYPSQWAHTLAGVEAAWNHSTGSRTVRVGVLDSGVLGGHPDLADNIVEQVDASTGTVHTTGTNVDNDPCGIGHGTMVSGVLGALGDNATDVAGVNWQVSILDVSLSSPASGCGGPRDDAILAAIDHATSHPDGPVDVINLSFGTHGDACPASYQSAIDAARAAGIVVVAASGNEELDPALAGSPSVPASCNGVISVGAVGRSGTVAGYSTTNRYVDLAAPGGDSDADGFEGQILTTSRNGRTEPTEGTSFASPYVAGLAALLGAIDATLTPDQIEALLERTAADQGVSGRDPAYGWGLVQAGEAAAAAASGAAVRPPEPDPDFPVGGDGDGEITPPEPTMLRIAAGSGVTEAISQAAAVSQAVFAEGGAAHAVLARDDDYADALAGSALGFGLGPVLFTTSTGPLAEPTKQELQRVLAPGSPVYLLGGGAALPDTLEGELRALGYEPVRLAGAAREQTAILVADEVRRRLPELGFENLPIAILATRQNWPDAVAAGSLAAWFGIPILLTPASDLHPDTEQALRALAPSLLYGIGGTVAISDTALAQAASAAGTQGNTVRLAGPERTATAVAVASEFEAVLREVFDSQPAFAVAVNLRRADGFAHVLSATAISGAFSAVFVPVEGDAGTILTEPARQYATGLGVDGLAAGDADLIADATVAELEQLLQSP
ncbi:MAG TPA: S8 family serine peptidase, partial [Egibacteraceae bacterium]|nr:S8 family serine peptidase [Egibacteraceae bacterium]